MAIKLDFLRQLDKFQLALKKRVHSQYQGSRDTHQFGQGLLFKDFREYVPGDDIRFIDWKIYARTNKFYIKRFEEERNLTVHIIVDSSASMDYGTGDYTKFDYASMIGLGFAYMALRNNEKFNFNTFAEDLDIIRPKKGMDQLMSIVDHLNEMKPEGKSNFRESLDAYKKTIKSKSIVVIISDFLYDVEDFKAVLQRYKKSELILVQVLDPSETRINLMGDFILHDSEQDTKVRTFISRRMIKNYSEKLSEHIALLKDSSDDVGAIFMTANSDMPIFDVFYNILTQ